MKLAEFSCEIQILVNYFVEQAAYSFWSYWNESRKLTLLPLPTTNFKAIGSENWYWDLSWVFAVIIMELHQLYIAVENICLSPKGFLFPFLQYVPLLFCRWMSCCLSFLLSALISSLKTPLNLQSCYTSLKIKSNFNQEWFFSWKWWKSWQPKLKLNPFVWFSC